MRDRFIAGQAERALDRHLDSIDTAMRDIVDSCRVWEGHAEATDSWGGGQDLEYPRAMYQVVEDSQSPVVLKELDQATVIVDANEGDSHFVRP